MEAAPAAIDAPPGLSPLTDLVRVSGPAADVIRAVLAHAWVAPDFDSARDAARMVPGTVVTLDGDVFRGSHVVEGGVRAEAKGILATRREIKELRERADEQRAAVERVREDLVAIDLKIAAAESATASLQGEQHRQEKAVVGFDLQIGTADEASERIARKREQIAVERRSAEEEQRTQDARQEEARQSIARIEADQREADDQLNRAQRRSVRRTRGDAGASRIARRKPRRRTPLSSSARARSPSRSGGSRMRARSSRRGSPHAGRTSGERECGGPNSRMTSSPPSRGSTRVCGRSTRSANVSAKPRSVRSPCAADSMSRTGTSARRVERSKVSGRKRPASKSPARRPRPTSRIWRLRASSPCRPRSTRSPPKSRRSSARACWPVPKPVDDRPEAAEIEEDAPAADEAAVAAQDAAPAGRQMTPDEMVTDLRTKIERMGAVNMMAIDQFDDLESRHAFLTTQRKDLVDAIASTGEAIRKIDKTTKERFREAFAVINQNFEHTFTTLFGGGRAGLVLLDESDQLESGIDIIAQPPGKRLQNVQLLSGGEKALTAMALMFAIFKYRPSPFCLLDEIDAPLDDANIGRFVEMLQGMQEHTQFILITHNRKTMEIADRLWGVTMEEPGVSKLISVQLN